MKKKTQEEFMHELVTELTRTEDLENYDLSKVEYITATVKVRIICKKHGEKLISPFHLLNGRRCKECMGGKLATRFRADIIEVIKKANEVHNYKYDYSKFKYINSQTKGIIICKEHGEFFMDMNHHINREQKCNICKTEEIRHSVEESLLTTFVEKSKNLHGDRYSYDYVIYLTAKDPVLVTCPKHGNFQVTPDNHINALSGCPKCSHKISLGELEIRTFIESLGLKVICNKPLLDRKHIDIFIPSLNIGIEYCGLYYHSDKFKSTVYHRDKYLAAKFKRILLIQIFEDEWLYNKDIVKECLKIKLLKSTSYLYARKLIFRKIDNSIAKELYYARHLQGGNTSIGISFGLFSGEELLAAMSFSSSNVEPNTMELVRFSSIGRINGGFSKLLSNAIPFLKDINKNKIISFSDNRWSNGGVYDKNGFQEVNTSITPRYWWVKEGRRYHRRLFQRKYLIHRLEVFDENLSEAANCIANGYLKIHDAGVTKWHMEI